MPTQKTLSIPELVKIECIAFAEWKDRERWHLNKPSGTWFRDNEFEFITGEQLYKKFELHQQSLNT